MAATASRAISGSGRWLKIGRHLDVVRYRGDAVDPFGGLLGLALLCVAADKAAQGHDAVLHRNRDVGCVNVGVPAEFRLNVAFDVDIGAHGCPRSVLWGCGRVTLVRRSSLGLDHRQLPEIFHQIFFTVGRFSAFA